MFVSVFVCVVNVGLVVWCVGCSLRILGDHSSGFAKAVSENQGSLKEMTHYLKQSAKLAGLPSKLAS